MSMLEPGMLPTGGNRNHQNEDVDMNGGRRRRRRRGSRTRGGRSRRGRGGYLMDAAVAAGLLGVTQLGKARAGYGFTGKNGYYGNASRKRTRRSRSRR